MTEPNDLDGENVCANCAHSIQTDVFGLVVCDIDGRIKEYDLTCKSHERNA